MSNNNATLVSPKHIDYILTYAHECGLHFHQLEHDRINRRFNANVQDDLDLLGHHLTAVNQAAVNYVYRETTQAAKYTYRTYRMTSDDSEVQVLKALDCYEHLTSDLPQYKATFAAQVIGDIRAHAISQLPGYRNADWEITA